MWSAEMLLDFNLARNESRFENIEHSPGLFEFDYIAGAAGFDLTTMIPINWSEQRLHEILIDGIAADWVVEEIKGIEYALFTTQTGEAHVAASYAAIMSADFNRDGHIDDADFAQWQGDFGVDPFSDADSDGDSDGDDFLAWQRQFASDSHADIRAPVPEASTLTLFALGALAICLSGRRVGVSLRDRQCMRKHPTPTNREAAHATP